MITDLKYRQKLVNAKLLSSLLIRHIRQRHIPKPQALLPVPLHTQRIRERGFNQALELARPLAKYWDIPILKDAVIRHKNTPTQTGLSARGRQKNLRGAFEVNTIDDYHHVAIVDDVVTTGATSRELAILLGSTGIGRIDVIAVARAQK